LPNGQREGVAVFKCLLSVRYFCPGAGVFYRCRSETAFAKPTTCREPTHHLRYLARHLHYLARLVQPGFLGEPFVIGLADWAVGAREEHRTASKTFAIRFDARGDCASCLRAFDHDDSHLDPPCSGSLFFGSRVSVHRSVGSQLSSPVELAPTDPGSLFCKFDSGDFLQGSGDALPDRLGSLGRDFLNEVPKVLVLCGHDVEVLAALCG